MKKLRHRIIEILTRVLNVVKFIIGMLEFLFIVVIEDIFEVEGVKYSIIDERERTVRVGTGVYDFSQPNAVSISFTSNLTIPNFVIYQHKLYRVIECGTCAFAYCDGLKSLVIGYSVEVVRNFSFFRCHNIGYVLFEVYSRLKTIEANAFYDNYASLSITFGGSMLEYIGADAFGFNFRVQIVRLPSSVKVIEPRAFRGFDSITLFEYCGTSEMNNEIFYRNMTGVFHMTPVNILIKVTSGYPSSLFGNETVTVDNNINCTFPTSLSNFELHCETHYCINPYTGKISYLFSMIYAASD